MTPIELESLTPEELQAQAQSVQAALEKNQKEQARHVLAEARRLPLPSATKPLSPRPESLLSDTQNGKRLP